MMEQVLLNLAVNARDAMPRGGQLGIRIAVVELNEAHVQLHPEARVGTFVCISKSDTGCGSRKKTSPASSSRSSPPRTSARAPVSVSRRLRHCQTASGLD